MHNRTQFAFTLGRNDPIKPDLLHGWSEQEASFTWMIDAESAVTLPEFSTTVWSLP